MVLKRFNGDASVGFKGQQRGRNPLHLAPQLPPLYQ
jgi:hypothetical protein